MALKAELEITGLYLRYLKQIEKDHDASEIEYRRRVAYWTTKTYLALSKHHAQVKSEAAYITAILLLCRTGK